MNVYSSVHDVTSIVVEATRVLDDRCISRKIIAQTATGRLEIVMFGAAVEALAIKSPVDADLLVALKALLIWAEGDMADAEDVCEIIAQARAAIAMAEQQ